MNLSARDLKAFIALAEERNFTRAAERVHLSQSAFSTLIQNVEQSLGGRLFERSTRNVLLTTEGKLFESSARAVLADLESMVSDFRDHAEQRKGKVAVAALPSLAAGWLPGVLAEYRRLHPGVELCLIDKLAEECKMAVRARQADFAIATAGEHDMDLASEPLCEDEFHLVCRKDHPLAARKRIGIKDLASEPFVHMSRNSSVRHLLEAATYPTRMRTVLEVEHLATASALVAAGLGVTLVPALTLFQFRHPELAVRGIEGKGLTRKLVIMKRKGEGLSAAARALHALMLKRRPRNPSGRPARLRS